MSIAQGIILGLIGLALFVAAAVFGVLHLTAPSRELNREFFFALSNGDTQGVRDLSSSQLNAELDDELLQNFSAAMAPFVDFRFATMNWENGRYQSTGSGWTETGCTSALSINRFNGKVTAFQVEPTCGE